MKAKLSFVVFGLAIIFLLGISIFAREKIKQAESVSSAALTKSFSDANGAQNSSQVMSAEQSYKEYLAFRRDIIDFLKKKDTLAAAERERRGKDLMRQVDQREQLRHVNAGEAYTLKLSLIEAIEPDPQKRIEGVAELSLRYKTEAERKQAEFVAQQNRDPRFRAYKAREAQIVAEVQAMQSFPSGMSRDEYLRQRLLEARAAIYYAPTSGGPSQPPIPVR
jgi:hypothetical protein